MSSTQKMALIEEGKNLKYALIADSRILQSQGTVTGVLIASSVVFLFICAVAVWVTLNGNAKKRKRRRMEYHQQNQQGFAYNNNQGNLQMQGSSSQRQYQMQNGVSVSDPYSQSRRNGQGDGFSNTSYHQSGKTPMSNNTGQINHYDQSVAYGDHHSHIQSFSNEQQQAYPPDYQSEFNQVDYHTHQVNNQESYNYAVGENQQGY